MMRNKGAMKCVGQTILVRRNSPSLRRKSPLSTLLTRMPGKSPTRSMTRKAGSISTVSSLETANERQSSPVADRRDGHAQGHRESATASCLRQCPAAVCGFGPRNRSLLERRKRDRGAVMAGKYNVTPVTQRNYPTYRYREMLAAIGSDKDVQALIESAGFEKPTINVIRGWRARNSIPSRWLPLIMHRLMQEGALSSPAKLIKEPF